MNGSTASPGVTSPRAGDESAKSSAKDKAIRRDVADRMTRPILAGPDPLDRNSRCGNTPSGYGASFPAFLAFLATVL